MVKADVNDSVNDLIHMITKNGISQIPVFEGNEPVGSITEGKLFSELFNNPSVKELKAGDVMQEPFTVVEGNLTLTDVAEKFERKTAAVLYKSSAGYSILTKHDIIKALAD